MVKKVLLCVGLLIGTIGSISAKHFDTDGTFGLEGDGNALLLSGHTSFLSACCLTTDNKIVVAGASDETLLVVRYLSDGNLDSGFNNGEPVNTLIGTRAEVHSVLVDASNRIVVVGYSIGTNGLSDGFIARYNSDGTLDSSFNGTGVITIARNQGYCLDAVALQSDGKILVGGSTAMIGCEEMTIARYNDNGTIDMSFGTNGFIDIMVGTNSAVHAVAIQSDGKIVGAGQGTVNDVMHCALVRLDADGGVDNSFGTDGIVTTVVGNFSGFDALTLQSDGKILAGGTTDADGVVVRYLSSTGDLDTTFNGSGILTVSVHEISRVNGVCIQQDGKIIAAGLSDERSFVARYTVTGASDSTFGSGGIFIQQLNQENGAQAVAVQSDGRIVCAGYADNNGLLTRLLPSNAQQVYFNAPLNNVSISTATTPINGGSSESNAQVKIYINGNFIVEKSVGEQGQWDAGDSIMLQNDPHDTIRADLIVNDTVVDSVSHTVTETVGDVVGISTPVQNSIVSTLIVPVNGQTTAGADKTVKLYLNGETDPFAAVTTDAQGMWDAGTSEALYNGAHSIEAKLFDGATELATSSNSFTIASIPTVTVGVPAIGATIDNSTTAISGHSCCPLTDVNIYIDGTYYTSTTSDAKGDWTAGTSPSLTNGVHIVIAMVINEVGNIIAGAQNKFTVAA